jgi:hypothetical protein
MATYLEAGWYDPRTGRALRTEVIDGAMDVAGVLLRAGIAPGLLQQIALKVRSYVTLADPHMRGGATFEERQRSSLLERLTPYVTAAPELDSFIADCVEHVSSTKDLFALYLHLVHVTRMLQLLSSALGARGSTKRARRPKAPTKRTTVRKPKKPARATKRAAKK